MTRPRYQEPFPDATPRDMVIKFLIEAWDHHPEWCLGELIANAVRPGTGALALRYIHDAQLVDLLHDLIEGKPLS